MPRPRTHGRRFFVTFALVAAGGLAGTTLVPRDSRACGEPQDAEPSLSKQGRRWVVQLETRTKGHTFKGGSRGIVGLRIFTRDKRFGDFLVKHGTGLVWTAITRAAQPFSYYALFHGPSLARLERSVGQSLAQLYRKQTRRYIARPDLIVEAD